MTCLKCGHFAEVSNDRVHETKQYGSLPFLNMSSSETNIPHLTSSDVDLNMPTDINFKCYDTHDFHDDKDINECMNDNSFSILNCNIRSLSANFDNFQNMLSKLHFPFSVIGLTETKLKCDQNQIANTELVAYNFISQPRWWSWFLHKKTVEIFTSD